MNSLTDYVKEGFFALPAIPGKKRPYFAYADRMKDGWRPTVDEAQQWEKEYTEHDILLRTGDINGFWVLDLDVTSEINGVDELKRLVGQGKVLPTTPIVNTPRGGKHIYFKWEEQANRLSSTAGVFPGIDVRANGGIVIVPPSGNYTWDSNRALGKVELAECPDWLWDVLWSSAKQGKTKDTQPDLQGEFLKPMKHGDGIHDYIRDMFNRMVRHEGFNKPMLEDLGHIFQKHYVDDTHYPFSEISKLAKDCAKYSRPNKKVNYDLSDRGYVDAFFDMYPNDVLYSSATGWYIWNNRYWKLCKDSDAEIDRRLDRLRKKLMEDTEQATKDVQDWVRRLGNGTTIRSAMSMLKNNVKVSVDNPDDFFDQDHMYLNCANGVVDLRTGELLDQEDTRELYMSHYIPIEYKKDVDQWKKDFWQKHLDSVSGRGIKDDAYVDEWQTFYQRCMGYCLTGDNSDQVFFNIKGQGGTGKSATMGVIRHAMGSYGSAFDINEMLGRKMGGSHKDAIVALIGKRMALATEPPANVALDDSFVKSVTGQNAQQGSGKFKSTIEFRLKAKFIIEGNVTLRYNDNGTGAMGRRNLTINFDVKVKDRNLNIEDDLRAVDEAVLLWLVEGAKMWWEGKQKGEVLVDVAPSMFKEASQATTKAQDKVSNFLEEWFEWDDRYIIKTDGLFTMWQIFCKKHGYQAGSSGQFEALLQDRPEGAKIYKGDCTNGSSFLKNRVYYRGLRPSANALARWKNAYTKEWGDEAPLWVATEFDKLHGVNDLPKGRPLNTMK